MVEVRLLDPNPIGVLAQAGPFMGKCEVCIHAFTYVVHRRRQDVLADTPARELNVLLANLADGEIEGRRPGIERYARIIVSLRLLVIQ